MADSQPTEEGQTMKCYGIWSNRGWHGNVWGYRAACARARAIQREHQAAYGVDVRGMDGARVYTARGVAA